MEAKFLINISQGTFGAGQTILGASNVIKIDDFREVPNQDYSSSVQNTYTKYLDAQVYSIAIPIRGADLLNAIVPSGYNSGLVHNLGIIDYVETTFRITNADEGDIYGGGFRPIENYFGARDIAFLPDAIAFKLSADDGVIQPDKNYLFHLKFTNVPLF